MARLAVEYASVGSAHVLELPGSNAEKSRWLLSTRVSSVGYRPTERRNEGGGRLIVKRLKGFPAREAPAHSCSANAEFGHFSPSPNGLAHIRTPQIRLRHQDFVIAIVLMTRTRHIGASLVSHVSSAGSEWGLT
jgi:hypothetical protein